jgi:hypothetical protein
LQPESSLPNPEEPTVVHILNQINPVPDTHHISFKISINIILPFTHAGGGINDMQPLLIVTFHQPSGRREQTGQMCLNEFSAMQKFACDLS